MWVESTQTKWSREWCVLWPAVGAHPQHGQFLFSFVVSSLAQCL